MSVEQLLDAIVRGSLTEVQQLLDRGVDVNAESHNFFGRTPLTLSIMKKQPDIVKLLLEKGADPDKTDENGYTPLILSIVNKQPDIVKLLLEKGVDPDKPDLLGLTPLHWAVDKNQTEVVDMLVFLGVDINHRNEFGKTVSDLRLDQPMLDILNQQTVVSRPVDIFSLKRLEVKRVGGIKVKCGSRGDLGDLSTFLLLKHYSLAENKSIPHLQGDELAWSDVYELRKDSDVELTVTFPLQDQPDRFSELLVKYGIRGEPKNAKIKYNRDKACCEAVAEISIGRSGWFYLCCRQKLDRLYVPARGGRISSTLDPHLTLDVPMEAFKTPGDITIKAETFNDNGSVASRGDGILAVSNFYQMRHSSGQQPVKAIPMTIPLSDEYTGNKEISILYHNGSKYTEDKNGWEVMATPVKVKDRCASFSTKTLTGKVLLESDRGTSKEEKKQHAADLYKGRNYVSVEFIVCGKKINSELHDVVIECCKSKNRQSRVEHWHYEQYSLLRKSGMFLWKSGTLYGMETDGNLTSREDISRLQLVYHPGMVCSQSMTLTRVDERKDGSGSIAITDLERTKKNGENAVITYLPLRLHDDMKHGGNVNKKRTEKRHPRSVSPDMKGAPVSDSFFAQLVQKMPPDFLVFIPLGLTFDEIKKIQKDTVTMDTNFTMLEMLVQCRRNRGDNSSFFRSLLDILKQSEYNDTKQWVLDWTTRWLSESRNRSSEFAKQIRPIIARFDTD